MYKEERSCQEPTFSQRKRTPSFSSSLLDAIYRSIDESNGEEKAVFGQYTEETLIQKQSKHSNSVSAKVRGEEYAFLGEEKEKSSTNLRRAIMIQSWMEKQSTHSSNYYNSTSCSSVFSSSEAESSIKQNSRKSSSSSCYTPPRKNPHSERQQKVQKCDTGGFSKTKLRAMKIYGELKKVKQPLSPGGRIASFLNSIFSSESAKKVKMCSNGAMEDVNFDHRSKSEPSSVFSFSRSCLSKTPPSRGKSSNPSAKRTVRFYPVTVIVDEDSRPCGHKCIYEHDPGLMPIPQKIKKSSSIKDDVVRGGGYVRRSYQKKNKTEFDLRHLNGYIDVHDDGDSDYEDDDDDDDDESCSSSDLFELDHLIGIGRYREELPVYETTSLKTNQAIANGFIL